MPNVMVFSGRKLTHSQSHTYKVKCYIVKEKVGIFCSFISLIDGIHMYSLKGYLPCSTLVFLCMCHFLCHTYITSFSTYVCITQVKFLKFFCLF